MISPKAEVSSKAKIGKNVKIGAFTVVEDDVVIGDNCIIANSVSLLNGCRIGDNCEIFQGAVISGIPQDLKYNGEETLTEIGDNCKIRENVTINKGTASKGKTVIGNNVLVMANAHVGHDCVIGDNVILGFSIGIAGEVIVDQWANLSGMSGVHQFTSIGAYTMVEGVSKIGKDVPPFVKAGRIPLVYSGINVIGLRRHGFDNDKIEEIHNIYRVIYQKGLNTSQALAFIENNFEATRECVMIVDFIKKSTRGIIRSIGSNSEE